MRATALSNRSSALSALMAGLPPLVLGEHGLQLPHGEHEALRLGGQHGLLRLSERRRAHVRVEKLSSTLPTAARLALRTAAMCVVSGMVRAELPVLDSFRQKTSSPFLSAWETATVPLPPTSLQRKRACLAAPHAGGERELYGKPERARGLGCDGEPKHLRAFGAVACGRRTPWPAAGLFAWGFPC